MMIAEIVLMKGKSLTARRGHGCPLRGLFALDPRARRTFLIQTDADAFFPKALLTKLSLHLHLTQMLAVEVRQLQVLEHHFDKLVETDFGFIIIDARLISRLLALSAIFPFAYRLAGLNFSVASLSHARHVLTIDKAVLLDAADRHLHDAILAFSDDGLFGDDIGDVVADGFADFLTMTQAVARAAVTALARGRVIFPKDGFHGESPPNFQNLLLRRSNQQSFQRLLAAYFKITSTQLGQ